ncbi:MAG: hypothetical protein R3E83_13440 [Burkholderiaceae bacterium]
MNVSRACRAAPGGAQGCARFQETTIFKGMTVHENGHRTHLRSKASLAGFFLGSPLARFRRGDLRAQADEIIEFLGLGGAMKSPATCRTAICDCAGHGDRPGHESRGDPAR